MKKNLILVALVVITISLHAQSETKEKINFSGSITLSSQTNSLFTGGRFSDKPALNARISANYRNFTMTFARNSDLLDSKSGANLFVFSPSYSKTWGKYNLYLATELNVFDHVKTFNLIAPYAVIGKRGFIDTDLMAGYARTFQDGDNIWLARFGVGKKLNNGYSFKLYAWVVDWGGVNYSLAGEVAKEIAPKVKLAVYYHLNNFTAENHQEFGAIRLSYSF